MQHEEQAKQLKDQIEIEVVKREQQIIKLEKVVELVKFKNGEQEQDISELQAKLDDKDIELENVK